MTQKHINNEEHLLYWSEEIKCLVKDCEVNDEDENKPN